MPANAVRSLTRVLPLGGVVGGLIASGAAAPAGAQEAGSPEIGPQEIGIEQIVVSARKRTELLEDVPVSITVVSGAELKSRDASNITEIAAFTPGLTIDFTAPISGSSASVATSIRGIGSTDFLLTFDQGVGIYVDGVYVARSVGSLVDLLDVARIEVLKGPQGTLFGRNTIGGAISIVSSKPAGERALSARGTVGSDNRVDLRVSGDIPLFGGALLSRVAFSLKNQDGYGARVAPFQAGNQLGNPVGDPLNPTSEFERTDRTRLGSVNASAARLSLYYPGETFEAEFNLDYSRARETSPAATLVGFTTDIDQTDRNGDGAVDAGDILALDLAPITIDGDPSDPLGLIYNTFNEVFALGLLPYDDRWLTDSPFTNFGTAPSFSNYDIFGLNLTVTKELGPFELKSITAFRDLDASFAREGDLSPITLDHTANEYQHQQFSQELQLSGSSFRDRLKWVVGLYYFDEDGRDRVQVPLLVDLFLALDGNQALIDGGGLGAFFANPGAAGLDLFLDEINVVNNRSIAAFGQATFAVTDALSITAGVRWTEDKKRYRPDHFTQFTGTQLLIDDVTETFNDIAPRVSIDYRWSDGLLTYVSYSEGFKSGGFTGRTVDPQPDGALPFEPENVRAYEVGVKSSFLERRVQLNAAGYFSDYTNLQLVNQQGVTPLTVNAGQAEILGAEVELQAVLSRNLRILAGYSYIDAKYTEITDPFATTVVTDKFVNTPEHSVNISAVVDVPVPNLGGDLQVRADYSYTSEIFNDAENTPELRQPGLSLLDAAVSYMPAGDGWQISAGGHNLTNRRYIVSGFNQPGVGFIEGNFARPRTFYATVEVSF